MAQDLVGIYNMALTSAGASGLVSRPDEDSREAELCELWYTSVRDRIFAAAPWQSLRAVERLAVISTRHAEQPWTDGLPEPPWRFAYGYPMDMVRPRFISDYRNFVLGRTGNARSILTDTPKAILTFTKRNDIIQSWEAGLQQSVIFGLAAAITIPLSGDDQRAMKLLQEANAYIIQAQVDNANSQQPQQYENIPDWLIARGYAYAPSQQYFYPSGPTLTLTGIR